MHPDDFIDDIARRMTTGGGAPGMVRRRVRTAIDLAPRQSSWSWRLAPAGLGVMGAAVVLALLIPASTERDTSGAGAATKAATAAPTVSAGTRPAPEMSGVRAATEPAPAASSVRAGTRPGPATPVRAEPTATANVGAARAVAPAPLGRRRVAAVESRAPATILPPLPGPDPIVVEPVSMERLQIEPLTVEAIELTAIAIPPLTPSGSGGV